MRIGAHVRAGKGLVPALDRGAEIGADVVQIFTQSPRMWKPSQYGPEVLAAYREAQRDHPEVSSTFCHATYLINLATPDPWSFALLRLLWARFRDLTAPPGGAVRRSGQPASCSKISIEIVSRSESNCRRRLALSNQSR